MRFLADMGVDRRVVAWLRGRGHDAVHLGEEGLHESPDSAVFEKAHLEKRIILTFDLDFGEIVAFSKDRPVSVILFRLRNTSDITFDRTAGYSAGFRRGTRTGSGCCR